VKPGKVAQGNLSELRRQAAEQLFESRERLSTSETISNLDTQRLVHELQVHQIELELQNEELQRAQAVAKDSLARYTELYDFAPAGYVTLGSDDTIKALNLTASRLLGQERFRLVGARFGLFVSQESLAAYNAFLKEVLQKHAKASCEVELCTETAKSLWVHIEAEASPDRGSCLAVLVDTTQRRRMDEILRFQVTLMQYAAVYALQELLEKTLDAIGALTGSPIGFYHFVEADQKTLSLQAWSTRTAAEFCSAEGQGSHYAIDKAGVWVDCVHQRRPVIHNDYASLPHRKGLPQGHSAVVRELVVPVMRQESIVAIVGVGNKSTDYIDDDVEVVSFLADISWEIIQRKRTEQALQESERNQRAAAQALRQVDHDKSQFLAMLSHELRNPLTPISNSLFILDRAVPGSEQARRAQAVIGRQFAQLSRLVDDLLDVTRISQNKINLRTERLELSELVQRVVDDHNTLFEKNDVRIEFHPAILPLFVDGDANRLAQVVGNLIQNSAKFTVPGGLTSVSVGLDAPAKHAEVRVADTGIGIAQEMLLRLFEPFVQAETTQQHSRSGLGLGLSLVKGLVELHGGSIEAHSAGLRLGAEFTVRLPLALQEDSAARVAQSTAPPPGIRRRVLVIDDNADAADSLREALEFLEHQVEVAYDGRAGIAIANEYRPDVVLCDIGLPGLDGYGVAQGFRANEVLRSTYLVALSGYALPEDLTKAQEAGFDRHLAKPPSLEQLEALLAGKYP
jgi:two-component system CheB/CheR fusion protein